jgi:hypothetical protein
VSAIVDRSAGRQGQDLDVLSGNDLPTGDEQNRRMRSAARDERTILLGRLEAPTRIADRHVLAKRVEEIVAVAFGKQEASGPAGVDCMLARGALEIRQCTLEKRRSIETAVKMDVGVDE